MPGPYEGLLRSCRDLMSGDRPNLRLRSAAGSLLKIALLALPRLELTTLSEQGQLHTAGYGSLGLGHGRLEALEPALVDFDGARVRAFSAAYSYVAAALGASRRANEA